MSVFAAISEGFEHLKLKDLNLGGRCPLAKKDETYAILAKIPTLTKLSLSGSDMESLSEGMCDASVIPFLTLRNARRHWGFGESPDTQLRFL